MRDFAADGVVYLELRTTPRAMPAAGLDKAGYVDAVLRAMKEEEEAAAVVESGGRIRTRLILSVDRRNTAEEAREVVALARRFRDRGVVGVDLCGDPTKGDVALFTPAFESARLEEGLKITVHFAEMSCSAGQKELNTILGWNPDRLGHVIHVSDDFKRQVRVFFNGTFFLSCFFQGGVLVFDRLFFQNCPDPDILRCRKDRDY